MLLGPGHNRFSLVFPDAEQVIEPICSSPGFAWLANVFEWGWHPKVEMKAVWVQSEKSYLRIKGA
jgi:hypothetical protein